MTDIPSPPTTPWSAPYWEAARQGRLIIQRCHACEQYVFYPRRVCPFCFEDALDWVEATGRGEVYTYSVVENNAPSAFVDKMPYVIAVVILDEGVRLMSNIVECDPGRVHCGMAVEVTFAPVSGDVTLPVFRPAIDSDATGKGGDPDA
jgi:uncharacterized OB-fold protein